MWTRSSQSRAAAGLFAAWALLAALGARADPTPQCPPAGPPGAPVRAVTADEIPIAHTPPGGYGAKFPAPVLAACTEPLVAGAPDLRGLWKTLRAEQADVSASRDATTSFSRALSVAKFLAYRALEIERERYPVPLGDRVYVYVERIEQCGNRIVDMGGGTIADARADGTEANAVHDVSAFDFESPITAIASYEDGVFVLRPPRLPIAITRRLDADGHLVWHRPDLGDRIITLERIGGPCDFPPGTDWAR